MRLNIKGVKTETAQLMVCAFNDVNGTISYENFTKNLQKYLLSKQSIFTIGTSNYTSNKSSPMGKILQRTGLQADQSMIRKVYPAALRLNVEVLNDMAFQENEYSPVSLRPKTQSMLETRKRTKTSGFVTCRGSPIRTQRAATQLEWQRRLKTDHSREMMRPESENE